MVDVDVQLLRIALGAVLGAAIGWERERGGQPAGMRTHALVACGATLFTLVGAYGFHHGATPAGFDPSRVSAQIVSGIGFIGAGAILRYGTSVRGVTTAAALWTSAAVGMAAGAGAYVVAAGGVVVVLATLVGLRFLRERGGPLAVGTRQHLSVTYQRGHGTLGPLLETVERHDGTLQRIDIEDGDEHRTVRLSVRAARGEALRDGLLDLRRRPEIVDVTFEGPGRVA